MQLEFRFRNSILLKNAKNNAINFDVDAFVLGPYTTPSSVDYAALNGSGYVPMVWKQQVLPEFFSQGLALVAGLMGTLGAAKLAGKKLSRRQVLGISAIKN
jgi:hypothetical protein